MAGCVVVATEIDPGPFNSNLARFLDSLKHRLRVKKIVPEAPFTLCYSLRRCSDGIDIRRASSSAVVFSPVEVATLAPASVRKGAMAAGVWRAADAAFSAGVENRGVARPADCMTLPAYVVQSC